MSQNSIILPTTGTVSGLSMTQDTNNAINTLATDFSGASAPSSPLPGQTWHDTTNNIIKYFSLDSTTWIQLFNLNETAYLATPANLSQTITPQGRLTLSSNTPVMISDVAGATSIYYTPYQGGVLPLFNGTLFTLPIFTQLTLTLNSTFHPASGVFDVYGSLQGGVPVLSAMAWGSNTSRSASVGGFSGSANATITMKSGIWVNNAAIATANSYNGSTSYIIPQYQGTYLGTFYTTSAGQTSMVLHPSAASGGTGNILGLWNAYNRINISSQSMDNTSSWTYTSNALRAANGSNNNRISFVDGLQDSSLKAVYTCNCGVSVAGTVEAAIAIGIDSASATASGCAASSIATVQVVNTASFLSAYPVLGFHYVQALESNPANTGTASFGNLGGGGLQYQSLTLTLDM